jgi:hypothetical protein
MTKLPYPNISIPNDWDRRGLPAWTYHSPAMFALEREKLFMTHWQVVGHECDVPNPGDWLTYDMLGERAVVMRGQDGVVRALYAAARTYLLALDHAGAAEVRAGLPEDPGAEQAVHSHGNAVVDAWLPDALAALAQTRSPLAAAIGAAATVLDWITYDLYPPDRIGPFFARGHAFASILGEASPFAASDFELGLFLIAPGVLYRDHRHPAPELYAPLTGPHGWRFGPGKPLMSKPAHDPVWNPAHQPHLTRVGSVPFLCLFVWTRDVNQPAVVIDADDWAMLEQPPHD